MNRDRLRLAVLAMVALGVWAWNAGAIWRQVAAGETPDNSAEIPELSDSAWDPHSLEDLPELTRDPFAGDIQVAATNRRSAVAEPGLRPLPAGRVTMVMNRGEVPEAVFVKNNGVTVILREGAQLDGWLVQVLTMDSMILLDPQSERLHEYELP